MQSGGDFRPLGVQSQVGRPDGTLRRGRGREQPVVPRDAITLADLIRSASDVGAVVSSAGIRTIVKVSKKGIILQPVGVAISDEAFW